MRAGDRVRITAQLVQAATDKHLWAEKYDRDLRDILNLQSEVARDVAAQVRITLTPQERVLLGKHRRVDPDTPPRWRTACRTRSDSAGSLPLPNTTHCVSRSQAHTQFILL